LISDLALDHLQNKYYSDYLFNLTKPSLPRKDLKTTKTIRLAVLNPKTCQVVVEQFFTKVISIFLFLRSCVLQKVFGNDNIFGFFCFKILKPILVLFIFKIRNFGGATDHKHSLSLCSCGMMLHDHN
jgi:hypothetical protein